MSQNDVQTIKDVYDAFGRGDIPAVMAIFTDDVKFHVPENLPHGPGANGLEEVGQFFQRLGSTWDEFGVDVEDFVDGGDKVFVRGRGGGKLGGSDTSYAIDHDFHFRDGRVPHFDENISPPAGGFPG
jgi:ketosteroid isomerase-like protein